MVIMGKKEKSEIYEKYNINKQELDSNEKKYRFLNKILMIYTTTNNYINVEDLNKIESSINFFKFNTCPIGRPFGPAVWASPAAPEGG